MLFASIHVIWKEQITALYNRLIYFTF